MNDASSPDPAAFLEGGGEMGRLIRSMDWSQTPLGPIAAWPQSLRTTVSLCLASTFPISIAWGPRHIQVYNDGYLPICGGKHPGSLGQNFRECWESAWPAIGDAFEKGLAGEASFLENQRMFLDRNGYLEETFFTFSFSPIRDESGSVGGLFHPVTEQTDKMLSARRTRALRDLSARTAKAKSVDDVLAGAFEVLADCSFDIPFALLYQIDQRGATLAAGVGIATGTPASQQRIGLGEDGTGWPVAAASRDGGVEVTDLATRFGRLTCGPYPEPPHTAVVVPVGQPGATDAVAVLMLGVSARLRFNETYRSFCDMVAATLVAAIASAAAHEDQRRRAEALAELDRAKTQFFSNVSHEFRTPLTLMLGPIEDALGDTAAALSIVQRERLEVAHRNALRLLKLVNSMLDFSRIEAGRVRAALQPTDLALLTAELASNFRSACEKAGLALDVDCATLPMPGYVDRDMWEKIVLNLMSNAFKFTFTGSITVTMRAIGADVAELSVQDTGIGIPDAELPRLFERFHRVENSLGRTHEGTGIGLALVQELVKLHGGKIAVASFAGQGSRFTVTVPLGTAHLPPDALMERRAKPDTTAHANAFVEEALRWLPEAPTVSGLGTSVENAMWAVGDDLAVGPPRIVLADDNADMRNYVTRVLQVAGYQVVAVADGEQALQAVRNGPLPDLVLTDVMMPRLDGFGLLRELRADPAMEGVLVILLSARAGQEARIGGLAAGADDYLVKPFSARELRARVDSAVVLARQRREAAARERSRHTAMVEAHGRAALSGSEARLALALEGGKLGSWELDIATMNSVRSARHDRIFGYAKPLASWTYDDFLAHVVPEDRERADAAFRRPVGTGEGWRVECRIRRADSGEIRWIEVQGNPMCGPDGRVITISGLVQDITERQLAGERQRLLLDELNHRVKNTLATVQSMAMQMRRTASSTEDFADAFEARLAALSQAHDLLTREAWVGASLADVVRQTLAPYAEIDTTRIITSGPPVRLSPNAAVTLNMAFHELATNAAKYGALSVLPGRVAVDWTIDLDAEPVSVEIAWTESDGPAVATPIRRGFGSRLVERGLSRELGGAVNLDFAPAGVVCRITLPASGKVQLQ